ncbi:MAG TPA: hypothetical protein VJB70_01150 [Candidatus Paceibacterota bacterium]
MKSALFVDFDGTLCHDKFWRSLEPALQEKIQEYLFGVDQEIVNDWMRGVYTSEDIHQKLVEDLKINYEFLWNIFVEDCRTMFVEKSVLGKIAKLRDRYITVLITDNMDCFDRFTVPALGMDACFDYIVNSYNEKMSKNDNGGKLFLDISARIGGMLPESILIDNSPKTCEIFQKLGGRSFWVTAEKPLSLWLDLI